MSIATRITTARPRAFLSFAAVVFVLAFGVRMGFLSVHGVKITPDSADYIRLAQNFRAHGAFTLDSGPELMPTIRRAPLYPFFLAAFVRSGQVSLGAAATVQAILDAGVAVLILLLTSAALSLRWAFVAGLAYAFHPGAISFSTAILSEPLFTALSLIGVSLFFHGLLRNRLMLTALGGAAFGMATLCRPIALPLPFLLVGVSLLVAKHLPRRWLHAALLIACLAIVITPWLIRCVSVSGHFVFVQGFTPTTLYVATRTDWDQTDQEHLWARFASEDPYGRRLNAARTPAEVVEADRFGLSVALQNIRANPRGYLASRVRNVPYLCITSFDTFTGVNKSFGQLTREGNISRLALKLLLLLIFSLAPLVLAGAGVISSRRNFVILLCATVWIYTLMINFPVWIEYRYWLPAVPFLLVTAAAGAQRLGVWLCAQKPFHGNGGNGRSKNPAHA